MKLEGRLLVGDAALSDECEHLQDCIFFPDLPIELEVEDLVAHVLHAGRLAGTGELEVQVDCPVDAAGPVIGEGVYRVNGARPDEYLTRAVVPHRSAEEKMLVGCDRGARPFGLGGRLGRVAIAAEGEGCGREEQARAWSGPHCCLQKRGLTSDVHSVGGDGRRATLAVAAGISGAPLASQPRHSRDSRSLVTLNSPLGRPTKWNKAPARKDTPGVVLIMT